MLVSWRSGGCDPAPRFFARMLDEDVGEIRPELSSAFARRESEDSERLGRHANAYGLLRLAGVNFEVHGQQR